MTLDVDGYVSIDEDVAYDCIKNSDQPNGTQLLLNLINNERTVSIQVSNTFTIYESGQDTVNGKGSDVLLSIALDDSVVTLTKDSTGKITNTETPVYIVLGHELIHAYEAMEGNRYGWFFFSIYVKKSTSYTYTDQYGNIHKVKENLDELATVGLAGNSNYSITENYLRKENQLGIRVKY